MFSGGGILGGAPALTAWVTYRETKMVQRMKELCQYQELLTLCPRIYKWLILNEVYTVKALAAKIYMKRLYRGHLFCCIPNHGKKRKVEKKNTPRGVHHKLDKSSHHSPSPTLSPHFLWQAHLYIAMQACTTTSSLTKSCQSVQSTSINS